MSNDRVTDQTFTSSLYIHLLQKGMSMDYDLGTAEDWAKVLNRQAPRMPLEDIMMIVHTAIHGPESEAQAQRILDDEVLSRLLRVTWEDDPPSAELKQLLADSGPASQQLLSLA